MLQNIIIQENQDIVAFIPTDNLTHLNKQIKNVTEQHIKQNAVELTYFF